MQNSTEKSSLKQKFMILVAVVGLIGGIIIGSFLFKRDLDLRNKAFGPGGSDCGKSEDCFKIDTPQNSGSYTSVRLIDFLIIKAGSTSYQFPGSDTSCYSVTINQNTTEWQKTGPGPDCRDVSHVEVWFEPSATTLPTNIPTPTPESTNPPSETLPPVLTPTPTITSLPTSTPTPRPSSTPNPSSSSTPTPIPNSTATPTSTPTLTATPTSRSESTPGPTSTSTSTSQPENIIITNPTIAPNNNSSLNNPSSTKCCIGDKVVLDLNKNGVQEANEKGVRGVRVEVLDHTKKDVIASTLTNDNGIYHICDLTPSTYDIKFTLPAGYVLSSPRVGSNRNLDSDPDTVNSITQPVVLAAGDNNLSVDALVYVQGASVELPPAGIPWPTIILIFLGIVVITYSLVLI